MDNSKLFSEGLAKLIAGKFQQKRMTGWFQFQEIKMNVREEFRAKGIDPDAVASQPDILVECVSRMPLSIPEGSVIAGTQDDAFSPSYALINPAFRVETFAGYCDPTAMYSDLEPDAEFPRERIEKVRSYFSKTPFVKALSAVYEETGALTEEVAFFVESVTGHTIPNLRPALAKGVKHLPVAKGAEGYRRALDAALVLAERYAALAEKLMKERANDADEVARLSRIAANCRKVPAEACDTLEEAVQASALLWQCMCLEQAPNPYAFSVGNLDRTLAPYLKDTPRAEAVQLVRAFLAFLMVGERCWAISQNIMVGGRDADGNDLTNPMSTIVLDAFFESNNPQPALSVKLHKNTPNELYAAMGRFFFTPGHSTPSLFNDDMMFRVLEAKGIAKADRQNYSIAGCQEPLVMGKESGNTTNSWLNLGKVLELTIFDGKSALSGKKLGLSAKELGYADTEAVLADLKNAFFRQLEYILKRMEKAANGCTSAIALLPVPFTSAVMESLQTGRDMRDAKHPGVTYNGSGCLIHGLGVVTDSIVAVKHMLDSKTFTGAQLVDALAKNFEGCEAIHEFLKAQPKYGNEEKEPDTLAVEIAAKVSAMVNALRNPAGNPFLPDYSTPSTHLLYGYHVAATPDGRKAREMLGYGIDPRPESVGCGRQCKVLSEQKLDFGDFTGGYASHLGLSPEIFRKAETVDGKMALMRDAIIKPLFKLNADDKGNAPFYVYFNIDSAVSLRKVLANPKKYAPNGIYIMRIHGTFVNFLDLSPAIQEDIIARLDPDSTSVA